MKLFPVARKEVVKEDTMNLKKNVNGCVRLVMNIMAMIWGMAIW
jgi:hypothetical protein